MLIFECTQEHKVLDELRQVFDRHRLDSFVVDKLPITNPMRIDCKLYHKLDLCG